MQNHLYIWNKETHGHVCRDCQRVAPTPTLAALNVANNAFDAANDLGHRLGVSISVQNSRLRNAIGLHAAISVNTDQGLIQTYVSIQGNSYTYINGQPIETVPNSFRKYHSVMSQIDLEQIAEWTRSQYARYPADTKCHA